LRRAREGHDRLVGLARAGGESHHAEGRAHQAQELAPLEARARAREERGELALEQRAQLGLLRERLELAPEVLAASARQARADARELLRSEIGRRVRRTRRARRFDAHRWHVEQLVMLARWYSRASSPRCASESELGSQWTSKTFCRGRTFSSGWRWQPRHQSMLSVCVRHISGISSTSPWHVVQPMPFF